MVFEVTLIGEVEEGLIFKIDNIIGDCLVELGSAASRLGRCLLCLLKH